jgi:hypothetical protein
MWMNKARLWGVIAVAAIFVAACGGGDELAEKIIENSSGEISDVDIGADGDFNMTIEGENGEDINVTGSGEDEDFEMTIEGENGETMTFGGGEIPDNLTVAVMDGGEVTMSVTSGSTANVALQYPLDEYENLVDFYDAELGSGEDVGRTENSISNEDGTFRTVVWNDNASYDWTVSVGECWSSSAGAADAVCVTILETPDE